MHHRLSILCLAVLASSFAGPARGDLMLTIGPATVSTGGTGYFDVTLTSNAAAASPDLINNYAFQLQITNNGVNNTQLAFDGTQNYSYLTDTTAPTPYLFLGDSFDAQPPASGGSPTDTIYPNDTFTASDSTFSGDPVSLSSGTTYLLAQIRITTLTGAPPLATDSFTIHLVPASGSGSLFDNPNTYFDNFDFTIFNELSATPFSSIPGSVDVVASVPEPSSVLCAAIGVAILAVSGLVNRLRRGAIHAS
jgi:hypothetical protein